MIFRMEEWLKHDVSRSVDASLKDDLFVHMVQMFGVLERRFDQLLEVHKDLDVVLCIFMYHNSLQFLDKEHSNTIENKKRKKKDFTSTDEEPSREWPISWSKGIQSWYAKVGQVAVFAAPDFLARSNSAMAWGQVPMAFIAAPKWKASVV